MVSIQLVLDLSYAMAVCPSIFLFVGAIAYCLMKERVVLRMTVASVHSKDSEHQRAPMI